LLQLTDREPATFRFTIRKYYESKSLTSRPPKKTEIRRQIKECVV